MRAHHHQQHVIDKREISPSLISSNQLPTLRISSNNVNAVTAQPTASPTSVIVLPRNTDNFESKKEGVNLSSNFSSIIKPTRTTCDKIDQDILSKELTSKTEDMQCETQQNNGFLSRMVFRTSVISPNPEHLSRYCEKKISYHQAQQQPQQIYQAFNFNDPNRVSAFSKPQSIMLSVAIA
jgi:hypothetical protein